jgi:molybdopterin guanine dinucleotide-containing S/N-oxide reductase-like protein
MAKESRINPKTNGEKSYIKGLGFCGNGIDGNLCRVDVKDGKIIRLRPLRFDEKYKPEEFRAWKIEARGQVYEPPLKTLPPPLALGYKKRVYSANRVLYPMKRVDFNIKGDRHVENRGKSGYVRISWDEALDIIEAEMKRIIKKYGPYAIFSQSDGHGETKIVQGGHGSHRDFLDLLGGYTQQTRNPDSWEGWYWGAKHVWGCEPVGMGPQTNLMVDVAEYTDVLLHWGCDGETTTWGWAGQSGSRFLYWFTELGIKQVFICPDVNYSCAIHGDKWIPIFPNTDGALQCAIAYTWLSEDTYDKEYLKTHTVGFDKVKDYVLGKEDGIPKTPKWASEITGVPSRIIKALAREWAKKNTSVVHGNGGSYIRGPYSTEPARLEIVLLAMQGLGKPGRNQVKMMEWGFFGKTTEMPIPRPVVMPQVFAAYHGFSVFTHPPQIIPKDMVAEAINHPPVSWYGDTLLATKVEDQFVKYTYPLPKEKGGTEIKMIWTDSPCWITCWNCGNELIEALRNPKKIEFVLAQHIWFENDCLFADLILPVHTKFEEMDIGVDGLNGQYRTIQYEDQAIESLGESKSDWEIALMVADRFGLRDKITKGMSIEEWMKLGFDHSGVDKLISWDKFKQNRYYVIPTDPDWKKSPPGLRAFNDDPVKNPLTTPSGLLEIYSERLAKNFPDDQERPPYPKWIPCGETHQENLGGEKSKKYPILVVSNHPRWGVHANHQDITWFREAPTCKVRGADGYQYHPVWINPSDAAKRGISAGDVVKLYNDRGAVLAGAFVTQRVMPGVVSIDHGSKYDPIVPGELDRGGAINTIVPGHLTSKNSTGMATSGFLVEVERVDLDEYKKKYPEAWNRKFDPSAGLVIDGFVQEAK